MTKYYGDGDKAEIPHIVCWQHKGVLQWVFYKSGYHNGVFIEEPQLLLKVLEGSKRYEHGYPRYTFRVQGWHLNGWTLPAGIHMGDIDF
jgi:hypothetical protein